MDFFCFQFLLMEKELTKKKVSFQGKVHSEKKTESCWWKVTSNFTVDLTSLELHSKTAMQHSPKQLNELGGGIHSSMKLVWHHPSLHECHYSHSSKCWTLHCSCQVKSISMHPVWSGCTSLTDASKGVNNIVQSNLGSQVSQRFGLPGSHFIYHFISFFL